MLKRMLRMIHNSLGRWFQNEQPQQPAPSFNYPYINAHLHHRRLGYEIDLKVPETAAHRVAVRQSLAGRYYEADSHLNFKKILDYKGNQSAIHAGTFFGDMLHTYSVSALRVYAFEPVLENYLFAKKNTEALGLENVVLFNAALSDKNEITKIVTHDEEGLFRGGGSAIEDTAKGHAELVPALRLDDLPIENLCLLQLDIEGHEKKALLGAVNLIEWFRPVILIEDNRRDCGKLLERLGYNFAFKASGLSYWATPPDFAFVKNLEG